MGAGDFSGIMGDLKGSVRILEKGERRKERRKRESKGGWMEGRKE